jgi:hypothetical protein
MIVPARPVSTASSRAEGRGRGSATLAPGGPDMDTSRFDTLTRTLTSAGSRRRALVALSGVFGLAMGMASTQDSEAKKKCPLCKKRKNGKCKKNRPDGTACPGGTCQSGRCIAAAPSLPPPPPCATAAACPVPPASQLCAQATCIGGTCGIGPKAANTVCRPIAGECDVAAEVCEGTGLNCPANQVKPANTPCTSDGNRCTLDICDGSSSTCTHPPVSDGTVCGTEQSCCGGTCCIAGDGCSNRRTCCRGLNKPCGSNAECCSNNCSNGICLQ